MSAPPPTPRLRWACILLAGCAGRATTEDRAPAITNAAAPSAPLEDTAVSVAVAEVPRSLVIDGDLREWGALPRPRPSEPPPPAPDLIWSARDSVAPNPTDARQTMTFALDARGAYVAARLGAVGAGGLWLGVGFEAPPLPTPGKYLGNAGYVPLGTPTPDGCAQTIKATEDGQGYFVETRSPPAVAACQADVARHIERHRAHDQRFKQLYKLDASGVTILSENGEATAVPGARVAFGAHGSETTMEAFLPESALPRIAEAPIKTVKLIARAAAARPGLGAWVWLRLPSPVAVETHGALLAHAIERAGDHGVAGPDGMGSTVYRLPRALSYRLSDPSHVEVVDSTDCVSPAPRALPVYERTATLGDVEVGYVASPRGDKCGAKNEPWLAVLIKGKLVSLAETGALRGTVVRGGELHVLTYSDAWTPAWSAIAVAPDGSRREAVEPDAELAQRTGDRAYWEQSVEIPGRDADGFGFRGTVGKQRFEVTWRWDEARRMYRAKHRILRPSERMAP